MLATSLFHGGRAPHFVSEAVADCILFGMDKVRVTVSDVPDNDVRSNIHTSSMHVHLRDKEACMLITMCTFLLFTLCW